MRTVLPLHTNHLSQETASSFCNPRVHSVFYPVACRTSPGALSMADGVCEKRHTRAPLPAKARHSFSRSRQSLLHGHRAVSPRSLPLLPSFSRLPFFCVSPFTAPLSCPLSCTRNN